MTAAARITPVASSSWSDLAERLSALERTVARLDERDRRRAEASAKANASKFKAVVERRRMVAEAGRRYGWCRPRPGCTPGGVVTAVRHHIHAVTGVAWSDGTIRADLKAALGPWPAK